VVDIECATVVHVPSQMGQEESNKVSEGLLTSILYDAYPATLERYKERRLDA
jgi:hypothetical protein